MIKTLLTVLLFTLSLIASARAAILEWDRNPETNVLGYRVYSGLQSRVYDSVLDVGNATTNLLTQSTGIVFYAVTAYDTEGLESDFSDEVSYLWPVIPVPPSPPQRLRITGANGNGNALIILQESADLTNWTNSASALVPMAPGAPKFFRTENRYVTWP